MSEWVAFSDIWMLCSNIFFCLGQTVWVRSFIRYFSTTVNNGKELLLSLKNCQQYFTKKAFVVIVPLLYTYIHIHIYILYIVLFCLVFFFHVSLRIVFLPFSFMCIKFRDDLDFLDPKVILDKKD